MSMRSRALSLAGMCLTSCLLAGLQAFPLCALGAPLTAEDKEFLLAQLPVTADLIPKSAEQLIQSGRAVLAAASRQSCDANTELVGLGAALRNTSSALKRLEPMLLEKENFDLSALITPNPKAGAAMAENLRRTTAYRTTLDRLAEAADKLSALDPIAGDVPPEDAARIVAETGDALVKMDEKSGIGLHLKHVGEAMKIFRTAKLRFDKTTCGHALRLTGHMLGIAGENLAGSAATMWQGAAAAGVGLALFATSRQQETQVKFGGIAYALSLYVKALTQFAESFHNRAEIARLVRVPAEDVRAAEFFRKMGPYFDQQAARFLATATHIEGAARTLAAPASSQASAAISAGTSLREFGVFNELIYAGEALQDVGNLIGIGQTEVGKGRLKTAGQQIISSNPKTKFVAE